MGLNVAGGGLAGEVLDRFGDGKKHCVTGREMGSDFEGRFS